MTTLPLSEVLQKIEIAGDDLINRMSNVTLQVGGLAHEKGADLNQSRERN